jgi:hypothetical protein
VFQTENRQYQSEFIFKREPLRMNLHRFGRIVLGFLNVRKETPRILLITGLLTKSE